MNVKEFIEELKKYDENTEIEFVRSEFYSEEIDVYPKCVIFDLNKKVRVQLFNEAGW